MLLFWDTVYKLHVISRYDNDDEISWICLNFGQHLLVPYMYNSAPATLQWILTVFNLGDSLGTSFVPEVYRQDPKVSKRLDLGCMIENRQFARFVQDLMQLIHYTYTYNTFVYYLYIIAYLNALFCQLCAWPLWGPHDRSAVSTAAIVQALFTEIGRPSTNTHIQ